MRIKIDNDMKRIFTLMLLSLAVVMGGCEKDNTYEDPGLDVSLYNIAGVWKLATWNGGTELAEGSEGVKVAAHRYARRAKCLGKLRYLHRGVLGEHGKDGRSAFFRGHGASTLTRQRGVAYGLNVQ